MLEEVILVNQKDEAIGLMEKMEAHEKGLLHRAFSILIYNQNGEMLLQQRALSKYHSGGLWTNACCSHPRKEESNLAAAQRRLHEELGINCELNYSHHFIYKAKLDNELFEHELDHVFIGKYDGQIPFNTEEVRAIEFVSISLLDQQMSETPERFTVWFREIFDTLKKDGKLGI